MPTVPFSAQEITQIRYYAGFPAYATYGYELAPDMATLDAQCGYQGQTPLPGTGMSDAEQAQMRGEFLTVLPGLKTAIDNAAATLNVDTAAAFVRNKNEMRERKAQYDDLRLRMCRFIGCDPGQDLQGGGGVIRA